MPRALLCRLLFPAASAGWSFAAMAAMMACDLPNEANQQTAAHEGDNFVHQPVVIVSTRTPSPHFLAVDANAGAASSTSPRQIRRSGSADRIFTVKPVLSHADSQTSQTSISEEVATKKPVKTKKVKGRVRFADESGSELSVTHLVPHSDVPPDFDAKKILGDAYCLPHSPDEYSLVVGTPPLDTLLEALSLQERMKDEESEGSGGAGFQGHGSLLRRSPSPSRLLLSERSSGDTIFGQWVYPDKQPAEDYAEFMHLLDGSQYIAAENFVVTTDALVCTLRIKRVKDIKRVFARVTLNNWVSFTDVVCQPTQMTQPSILEQYVLNVHLPKCECPASDDSALDNQKVELALCVEFTDGEQRWDNNHGRNFSLIAVRSTGLHVPTEFTPVTSATGSGLSDEQRRYQEGMRRLDANYSFYNDKEAAGDFYW